MILTFDGKRDGLDATSFGDITTTPVIRFEQTADSGWLIEFDGTLTTRETWLVRIRMSTQNSTVEAMQVSLLDSYTDLRQIKNSTGTLTAANLSNAVRALATADIRIIRIMLGDTDGAAE